MVALEKVAKAWSINMAAYCVESGFKRNLSFASREDRSQDGTALCMQAKSATLTRCGVTKEQTVFGLPLRWCATLDE